MNLALFRRSVVCLASLAAASCVATEPHSSPAAHVAPTPTLEDVFLIPGLHGGEPRVRSLSADGNVVLVDWRPLERTTNGRLEWSEDQSPHALTTADGTRALSADNALRTLLERGERALHSAGRTGAVGDLSSWKPARPTVMAWSSRGARLALAWETAIVMLDPALALATQSAQGYEVLYDEDPPREDAEKKLDAAESSLAADSVVPKSTDDRRIGSVRSLEFAEDDSHLIVRAGSELYLLPLDVPDRPMTFEQLEHPTAALEASLRDGELTRDRETFFSRDKVLGKVTRTLDDGTTLELDAHVVRLASGERTHLADFDGIETKEGVDLSPDGRFVIAFEVNRGTQPAATIIPNYLSERVSTIEGRRELADDVAPPRKVWVWSTSDGVRRSIELPDFERFSTQSVGWAPEGETRLLLRRTSLDYRTVELWVWDETGARRLSVEQDPRWVGGPGSFARWSKDGTRVLFASECHASSTTPGRNQLFALDVASGAIEQLTEVEGEVWSFSERADGIIVFTAIRHDPAQRAIGVVRERAVTWLDVPAGMNTNVTLPAIGNRIVFAHSELGVPEELYLADLDNRAPCVKLTDTIPDDYARQAWIRPRKLQATHPDGTRIHSHVYLPRESSIEAPDRARPCVVFIHGAGYLQNVTDSMTEYAVNLMFHSRLAEMGYVVADVDYRGSAGYGNRFRTDVQNRLGELELQDIATIVDELARRGVIDGSRVACYGGSYGGFLTLMALFTEPDRWVGGAALRSVTDWRTYHPGYTQPRLGRPSENEDAYKRSSPIDLAEGLRDPLLILHGMVDTNVFAQDSVRLIEKLIDLGYDFDAMLYPSQGHAFSDGMHWLDEYKRIERFMVEHLGSP